MGEHTETHMPLRIIGTSNTWPPRCLYVCVCLSRRLILTAAFLTFFMSLHWSNAQFGCRQYVGEERKQTLLISILLPLLSFCLSLTFNDNIFKTTVMCRVCVDVFVQMYGWS